MAFRVPRFAHLHAAKVAGAANITATDSGGSDEEDASFPIENLIDDRAGSLMKFTDSAADHRIDIDRGAGFAALAAIGRIYIPAGHNITGNIVVYDDDAADFVGATTLLPATASVTGAIDLDFVVEGGAVSSQRYIRVEFAGTGIHELPQLILTKTLTPTIGPEPTFTNDLLANVLTLQKASGAAAYLRLGADRRQFAFEYRFVDVVADRAILDAIVELGEGIPFLLDPPYDDELAVWVTLTGRQRVNDHPVPASATTRTQRYVLELLEHVA